MSSLEPIQLTVAVVVVYLLEVILLWAAGALADAPEMGWGKTFLVASLVTTVTTGINGALGWYTEALNAPLATENRLRTAAIASVALFVTWLVGAITYVPLLSVSIPRSMLVSVFQTLLRAFLYVLIIAVLMVVLASLQIYHGTDVRTELSPASLHILTALHTP